MLRTDSRRRTHRLLAGKSIQMLAGDWSERVGGITAQQGYFDGANPVKLAEVPAFAPNGAETKPYTLEEIAAMLKVLSEPSATAVATAAFTGLRLGELRGLTWESFEPAQDEESLGWLNVTRSVWRSTVGDPKTAKSKAPVPVIPQLAQRLDAHRKRCGNPGGPD